MILRNFVPVKLLSTSVWGSELKYIYHLQEMWYILSTSVGGSELKYSGRCDDCGLRRLPLCEVVSWNIGLSRCNGAWWSCLPLCEVVSWMFLRVLCGIADLIQWWESPYRRYSEPVVHIPEVWCRKEWLYSYKFLSDSMKCSVFRERFKFCVNRKNWYKICH